MRKDESENLLTTPFECLFKENKMIEFTCDECENKAPGAMVYPQGWWMPPEGWLVYMIPPEYASIVGSDGERKMTTKPLQLHCCSPQCQERLSSRLKEEDKKKKELEKDGQQTVERKGEETEGETGREGGDGGIILSVDGSESPPRCG